MTSAWSLLIWDHCFHLHLRSHCRRSRSYSGLPSLASPDTESCPSPPERCQSWWDHLREDGKPSLVIVGGLHSPAQDGLRNVLFTIKCVSSSAPRTCSASWPASDLQSKHLHSVHTVGAHSPAIWREECEVVPVAPIAPVTAVTFEKCQSVLWVSSDVLCSQSLPIDCRTLPPPRSLFLEG